jgi:hypothetical protein
VYEFVLARKIVILEFGVQMQCSLSPDRSDVVIGQLVSLEVVQRSDEMPFLGPLSDWNELTNEMPSCPRFAEIKAFCRLGFWLDRIRKGGASGM